MAAIRMFGVTQHSQIFSLFLRNRIQCIVLYQLHNSQALLNLRRGYYSSHEEQSDISITMDNIDKSAKEKLLPRFHLNASKA